MYCYFLILYNIEQLWFYKFGKGPDLKKKKKNTILNLVHIRL